MTRIAIVLVVLAGCQRGARPTESVEQVLQRLTAADRAVDATLGGGRVRYLGFEATPDGALPNDQVTVVHYWVATRPLDQPYRVFVHALVAGAAGWIEHGDHDPIPSPDRWPIGAVIRDEHRLRLPERIPGDAVELRVGLYLGNQRLPVDRPEQQDGQNRVLAGRFAVAGQPVPLPSYRAPKLATPPVLDGTIDDAEWGGAPWSEPFEISRGGTPAITTRARLAWDDDHVYLAFDTTDPDILGTFTKRDEPVYQQEAVEIFIRPGAAPDYLELQVSPRGTQFDARFTGGARRNMNTTYDARYEVGVALDGTLNDPSDRDRGWRTEWSIELASLGGARIEPGRPWRINMFRVAKDRVAGQLRPDESAWSPPLMGDFHNLERFGQLWFSAPERKP